MQELFDRVSNSIEKLRAVQTYSSYDSQQNLNLLNDIVRDDVTRKEISQHLCRLQFPELAMRILNTLECKNGEYANTNIWMPVLTTMNIILTTTDSDAVISFNYMENGVVEFMKTNCCWDHYLSENNERITKILIYSVAIIQNISRFFSVKSRCGNSVNWLIPLLSITKGNIHIHSVMLLANMVDANNNAVLTNAKGSINDIISITNVAVSSTRHHGYHLWELLFAVGKLAKNDSIRKELKKCGVLDLLMTSIQKNDDNIQALALNIMLTMILDDNILSFCHSSSLTKDLRPILETIKDTDDFMLSNNAKSALQIINN